MGIFLDVSFEAGSSKDKFVDLARFDGISLCELDCEVFQENSKVRLGEGREEPWNAKDKLKNCVHVAGLTEIDEAFSRGELG